MTLAELIPLILKASIILLGVSIGMTATFNDLTYLLRRPALFARSFLSMNVIIPVLAATLAAMFDFHPAVKIALIALAVSPLPPMLPKKAEKAGGNASYMLGLLIAAGLISIIFVPLALEILSRIFRTPASVSPLVVAKIVGMTVLLPMIAGILIRAVIPGTAERIAKPLGTIAMILLVALVIRVVIKLWPAITSLVGNGNVAAFAVLVIVGLAVGHLLGGPDAETRSDLAFATSTRHPGVALAIGNTAFQDQPLVPAAVILFMLVCAIISIPYIIWTRRRNAQA